MCRCLPGSVFGVRILALCCLLAATLPYDLAAEEEDGSSDVRIVVSAHRYATPQDKVGSSVTVLTEEDLKNSQERRLLEVLRDVPGVEVVRSGGPGGNASVFIRGANSEHTLIRIDGIEMNNPGSNSRFFNLSNMTLENIERIEILRGPQGTLYGSDAIGGVISITTKKGKEDAAGSVSVEGGSFSTFREQVEFQTAHDESHFSFGFSREDSDGISAADETDGNIEEDGYENTAFSFRAGIKPLSELEINTFFRHNDSQADIDNGGGIGGDDPNRVLDTRETFFRTEAITQLFDGKLEQVYGFAVTNHRFTDDNDPDPLHPIDIQRSRYRGKLYKWDLRNIVQATDWSRLIVGIETEREEASSVLSTDGTFGPFESRFGPEDARTNGYYADLFLDPTDWFATTLGIRVDDHSSFDTQTTFRVAPTVTVPATETRFLGSVSTGYKAPSLFQLFSSYGNPALEPEESTGWEIGVEQPLLDERVVIGGTFYRNDIEQLVTFDPNTFVFSNIAEAEISGFEVFVRGEVTDTTDIGVDYTYLDTEDKATGERLLRRAQNQLAARINTSFMDEAGNVQLRVRYVGDRKDTNFSVFPTESVTLASYTVVDLAATYDLTENLEVFARVENLFDKDYEEVLGFGAEGVAGYGGIRVSM